MKAQYERIVSLICGPNWETDAVPADERDGGYGVAVCLACLQGVPPKLSELGDAIGSPPHLLEVAYKRLQVNGVFSYDSSILSDRDLKMSEARTEEDQDRCLRAWCHIAGLASGFIGKGGLRSEMQPLKKQVR